jgi:hypothetical protein
VKKTLLTLGIALVIGLATGWRADAATIVIENPSIASVTNVFYVPSCLPGVIDTFQRLADIGPGSSSTQPLIDGVGADDCIRVFAAATTDGGATPFFVSCSASTAYLPSPSDPQRVVLTWTGYSDSTVACSIGFGLPTPAALSALALGTARVHLGWTSTGDLSGFNIYRKTGSAAFTKVGTAPAYATSFDDLGLAAATTYTYEITAAIGSVESALSNSVSAATFSASGPPYAPSQLAAVNASDNSGAHVQLTWFDDSSDETSFRIERKQGTGSYQEVAALAANSSSYVDLSVSFGRSYTYRVRACNAFGCSSYSNESSTSL